jgi:hypothetical protein
VEAPAGNPEKAPRHYRSNGEGDRKDGAQTKKEWYVRQLEIALADVLAIGKQLEELHGPEPIWKK